MIEKPKQDQPVSTADIAATERRGGPGGTAMAPEAPMTRPKAQTNEPAAPLFAEHEVTDMRSRWDGIQTGFVDEPRKAVEQADQLVASTIKRLAEVFADERKKLETQWDRQGNVSTEDLRLALQRYRSFFSRLLSV